ncbi:translation elongation factor Ts [Fretibacterium sp. OH1220_COT-178]|uniref:translation elongation factor Ts n=1 Tax=Fretibacterium sp. OH1220_COT-178 TaxID=2491047 RepID=UPI000F5F31A9|nr:translation elongation factor Ts [Fretibacterium sp. OH1220_COT-178]RRD64147.1 translation elongation factor Ts [Fretibacterium sp. OH1220_COT-178]
MADISASAVKELRERTGSGMMDCKKALAEVGGSVEKAIDYLREKGLAKAAKKASRTASDGRIFHYVHNNFKVGALLELNSETDFVAKTDEFNALGHEIAMHITAANPLYLRAEDVPAEDLEREKEIYRQQLRDEGKPEDRIEKIVEGKVRKFYESTCLMEQGYIRDPDKKINDLVVETIAKLGENIVVRRFARFMIGE